MSAALSDALAHKRCLSRPSPRARRTEHPSMGFASRFSLVPSAVFSSRWGNVSKNSGKRLPDSFTGSEFHMYSWATVIKITIDDTFRPFVMRFFAFFELIDSDVDFFRSFSWCCRLDSPLSWQ
jgi:hypothetical protein